MLNYCLNVLRRKKDWPPQHLTPEVFEYWKPLVMILAHRPEMEIEFNTWFRKTPIDCWVKSFLWILKNGAHVYKICVVIVPEMNHGPFQQKDTFDSTPHLRSTQIRMEIHPEVDVNGIIINLNLSTQSRPALSALTSLNGVKIELSEKLEPSDLIPVLDLMPEVSTLELDNFQHLGTKVLLNGIASLARWSDVKINSKYFDGNSFNNNKWSNLTSLDISNCWKSQGLTHLPPTVTKLTIYPSAILDEDLNIAKDFPFAHLKELNLLHDKPIPDINIWWQSDSRHLSNTLVSYNGPIPNNLDLISTAFPNLDLLGVTKLEANNHKVKMTGGGNFYNLSSVSFRNYKAQNCACKFDNCLKMGHRCESRGYKVQQILFAWTDQKLSDEDGDGKMEKVKEFISDYRGGRKNTDIMCRYCSEETFGTFVVTTPNLSITTF